MPLQKRSLRILVAGFENHSCGLEKQEERGDGELGNQGGGFFLTLNY